MDDYNIHCLNLSKYIRTWYGITPASIKDALQILEDQRLLIKKLLPATTRIAPKEEEGYPLINGHQPPKKTPLDKIIPPPKDVKSVSKDESSLNEQKLSYLETKVDKLERDLAQYIAVLSMQGTPEPQGCYGSTSDSNLSYGQDKPTWQLIVPNNLELERRILELEKQVSELRIQGEK
jgi:hypothetical protein